MYNGVYTKEQFAYMYDVFLKWTDGLVHGKGIGDRVRQMGIQRLAVYGAAGPGRLVYEDLKQAGVTVVCFFDSNAQRFSEESYPLHVYGPEKIGLLDEECYLLVTPEYFFTDIMKELLERGFRAERIISLAMVV